ncbi:MAG TPA: Gfo/Idh/MocA family oxidoreductase [Prolixibacteraceae bacterium]|nr:Gfo/Idh/MocA family oxidoreductase [Prolixibacteraceae bacterium]
METPKNFTRRGFIGTSAATAAGFSILPSQVVGGLGHKAPSDKLHIAGIGVGGKGQVNLRNMNSENIVALCDIDWNYAAKTFNTYPAARQFKDYRIMLEEMHKDIDAVMIATPDHTHAVSALAAMQLGKHVYVQKPLTHTVYESRVLLEASRKYKVVTQMGNEGHSNNTVAEVCELIWSGAIGTVSKVDAWTDRPIWPQGLTRPAQGMWLPDNINWDLFIGPAAMRPYHSAYHPWNWRGWWDFGTGALGDMACHVLDVVFAALKLGHPDSVEASSSVFNNESAPNSSLIRYKFPVRDKMGKLEMPAVKVTWYDGGLLPSRPDSLPDGLELGQGKNGIIFHGSKGKLVCGNYGGNYKLLPEEKFAKLVKPPKTVRRVVGSHEMDWVRACKESPESRVLPASNFEYACPLNEMVVMGNLAVRMQGLQKKLKWDGVNMTFTNLSDNDKITVTNGIPGAEPKKIELNAKQFAAELVRTTYREGWDLKI